MTFVIESGIPYVPYQRPTRSNRQIALLNAAARSNLALKLAASNIHAEYYLNSAKTDGDQYYEQVKYLMRLISNIRRGDSPQNI